MSVHGEAPVQPLVLPPEDQAPIVGRTNPTVRDGAAWGWLCELCPASGRGFDEQHHARTIADEHRRIHRLVDLDGGSRL